MQTTLRHHILTILLLFATLGAGAQELNPVIADFELKPVKGDGLQVLVQALTPDGQEDIRFSYAYKLKINDTEQALNFIDGKALLKLTDEPKEDGELF